LAFLVIRQCIPTFKFRLLSRRHLSDFAVRIRRFPVWWRALVIGLTWALYFIFAGIAMLRRNGPSLPDESESPGLMAVMRQHHT
jgi:hypothetical protein